MYKIMKERFKEGFTEGALQTMGLLNELNVFDNLTEEEMEQLELKIIDLIESTKL